jgi:hypothetical protein
MTKKPRTGLQSRISNIFSGVPIPKKNHPVNESDTKTLHGEGGISSAGIPAGAENVIEPKVQQYKADLEQPKVQKTIEVSQKAVLSSMPQKPAEKPGAEQISIVDSTYKPDSEKKIIPQKISADTQTTATKPPMAASRDMTFAGTPLQNLPDTVTEKEKKHPKPYKAVSHPKSKARQTTADAHQKRQKVMLIIFIFFSILLVFLIYNPLKSSTPVDASSGSNEAAKIDMSPVAGAAASVINWPAPPDYPQDIHDPMVAAAAGVKQVDVVLQPDKPVVRGITYSEDRPLAIIGTVLVGENQEIEGYDGYIVIKINKDSVEFEKDGQRWVQQVENKK